MRWWISRDGGQSEIAARRVGDRFEVTVDGETHWVDMLPVSPGLFALFCQDGRNYAVASQRLGRDHWRVLLAQRQFEIRLRQPLDRDLAGHGGAREGPHEVRAPIPGKVVSIAVAVGDTVAAGQTLLVLEAMKMENQICAEGPGAVTAVLVAPGARVEGGQALVMVE